jgi:hypothetical protein
VTEPGAQGMEASRVRRGALGLLALLAVFAGAPTAFAKEVSARSDGVVATLSWKPVADVSRAARFQLTVVRRGTELFRARLHVGRECAGPACQPTTAKSFGRGFKALRVLNLEGKREPEILASFYWGGAHCCFIAKVLRLGGDQRYHVFTRNFGDPGFALRRWARRDHADFVSADYRFDYEFASFAESGLPLQVWRFAGTRFVDTTRAFPRRIARDAAGWWRGYRRSLRARGEPLGALAAWAADEYNLGRQHHVRAVLKRELQRGHLGSGSRFGVVKGMRFIRALGRFLRRLGYAR